MFSFVERAVAQTVQLHLTYVYICRNAVEMRSTYCATSHKMYSWPRRSNKNVLLCEVYFAYNPLIYNGFCTFGAHTCYFDFLSVEKCVSVFLGLLQYMPYAPHFPFSCSELKSQRS